ncbi:hypothetical protein GIB67_035691, partial [Kingdonia uniflora]
MCHLLECIRKLNGRQKESFLKKWTEKKKMDKKKENGQKGIRMDERNLTNQIGGETSRKPKSTLGFPKIIPHHHTTISHNHQTTTG